MLTISIDCASEEYLKILLTGNKMSVGEITESMENPQEGYDPMKIPESMQYITTSSPGGADVMYLAKGPLPQPKPDEVLIRVMAAGINRPDVAQRQGHYPPPPGASSIMGLEVAGEVVGKGSAVTLYEIGDRVCALTNGGGYAEYCVAPALQCLQWPKGYNAIQAAALPETYFTVWANLFQLGHLVKGESVLVHGGSSGIGVTAIQLAHEFSGGKIYATAGSDDKCRACIKIGASDAINYREEDFGARIQTLTVGMGVDVILDIVGKPYFLRNIDSLSVDGRLIQVATMQGNVVDNFDLRKIMSKRLIITGSTMRPRSTTEKAAIAKDLAEKVWPVLNDGRCAPVVYQVFPLSEVSDAHQLLESSQHIGKIMLKVD
jgi:NADPH2:quinone reductase